MVVPTPVIPENAITERLFLRPKEVAELVGLSESEIYRSIYSGDLKATKYRSRAWLVARADVEVWIARCSTSSVA